MPRMKAAIFAEPGRIVLESRPIPEVGPVDALLRVSTTTICGTDVHVLRGEYPVREGLVVGHEPVGIIEKLGSPIGWQVDPAAFRDTLLDAHERYGLSIYALENGAGAVEKPAALIRSQAAEVVS